MVMTMRTGLQPNDHAHICRYSPLKGWLLNNRIRGLFQNPKDILGPCVKNGMTAIDIGCGPGMFTLAMASMVGEDGRVIAVDIQQEMLDLVRRKSDQQHLTPRIKFHKSEPARLNVTEKADFILSFYMVHEVPDQNAFLAEVHDLLEPAGTYLVVEPGWHVSEAAFDDTVQQALRAGFELTGHPHISLSRAALFTVA